MYQPAAHFVLYCGMTVRQRPAISEAQWKQAADAYELGYKNTVEIAAKLGVSRSTVSREFKRRGCRKACRVAETVAELEARLDAKARRRAAEEKGREMAALERSAALDRVIGEMVKSLVAADRAGNLSAARPKIKKIGKALGVKGLN